MRWFILGWLVCVGAVPSAVAGDAGRVFKVLPQFLDHQGQHTLSPSLFERDAYQVHLRDNPAERGGVRFDIRWRMSDHPSGELKLRIETRSTVIGKLPHDHTFEQVLKWRNSWSHWTGVSIAGGDYDGFGELTAWRVTLWDADRQVAEAKSFLW